MTPTSRFEQDRDTDSHRIREERGFREPVMALDALARTIAWERANPPEHVSDLGILDDEAGVETLS